MTSRQNVLRRLRNYNLGSCQQTISENDEKTQIPQTRRTVQMAHHPQLSVPSTPQPDNEKIFCEGSVSHITPLVMVASEATAIGCAIFIILAEERRFWLAIYLSTPPVLKLAPILCCVKREPAGPSNRSSDGADFLVDIDDYDHGFPPISGPEEVVQQSCRHWVTL